MTLRSAVLGAALGAAPLSLWSASLLAQTPPPAAADTGAAARAATGDAPPTRQAATPAEVMPAEPRSGAMERDPDVEAIGRELRCPVCQGMPIGESPSEMAQAMMKRVRELHAEGKTHDEIRDYFVQRYGEWVLLKPEAYGFNLLVWVMPPAVLVAGLLAVVFYVQRTRRKAVSPEAPTPAPTDDPYIARVRERIEKGEA